MIFFNHLISIYILKIPFLTKRKSGQVRSYNLKSIITNLHEESIKSKYQTEQNFLSFYKNNIIVLPDKKTIVGVDPKTKKKLILEDITVNKHTSFGNHTGTISNLLYDQTTQTLFAGDSKGHVIQYEKSPEDESFVLAKDYGDVGVGLVLSSALVGEFALFTGSRGIVMAIDIKNRRRVERSKNTAFGYIMSLDVCRMPNLYMLLSVSGRKTDYSVD